MIIGGWRTWVLPALHRARGWLRAESTLVQAWAYCVCVIYLISGRAGIILLFLSFVGGIVLLVVALSEGSKNTEKTT